MREKIIDKLYKLTYSFNQDIYDICIDGNKLIFSVSLDFKDSLLDDIKKEFSTFKIILEKE